MAINASGSGCVYDDTIIPSTIIIEALESTPYGLQLIHHNV